MNLFELNEFCWKAKWYFRHGRWERQWPQGEAMEIFCQGCEDWKVIFLTRTTHIASNIQQGSSNTGFPRRRGPLTSPREVGAAPRTISKVMCAHRVPHAELPAAHVSSQLTLKITLTPEIIKLPFTSFPKEKKIPDRKFEITAHQLTKSERILIPNWHRP